MPAALRSLRAMLVRYYEDIPHVVVEPGVRTGVQLAIDNPKEVGTDRVVNALAAVELEKDLRGEPRFSKVLARAFPDRPPFRLIEVPRGGGWTEPVVEGGAPVAHAVAANGR